MTLTINTNSHIDGESSLRFVIYLGTHYFLRGPNRTLRSIQFVFHLLVVSSYLKPGE